MTSWKEDYARKLMSVEEAAKHINSGDKIWMSPGCSTPVDLIDAIGDRVGELRNVDVISGLGMHALKIFQSPDYVGKINYYTIFYGAYERAYFKHGNINIIAVNLSEAAETVASHYKVDTMIADVSPPDDEGYMYWGPMGNCVNGDMMGKVGKIIVQVNKYETKINGVKCKVHVSEVDAICERDHKLPNVPTPVISEVDQKIANLLIPRIQDGSTLQIGIGGLANAVGFGLKSKKDLSILTELFTESMMTLVKQGVVSGKILAAFSMGSDDLMEFVEQKVEMAPFSVINDPTEIAKYKNLVSINGCLMTDLTGQVCSESLGHNQYSAVGGQMDFVKGARMAENGQSFICLPSTATVKGKVQSTIVLNLPPGQIVTTPRTEVMSIVTEYGIADINNLSIRDRVRAMLTIAHPDFRDELQQQAVEAGLIPS